MKLKSHVKPLVVKDSRVDKFFDTLRDFYGVSKEDLINAQGKLLKLKAVSYYRTMTCYYLHEKLGYSFQDISRMIIITNWQVHLSLKRVTKEMIDEINNVFENTNEKEE